MFFFSSVKDQKEFHESCIKTTQEAVEHYEQSVKHCELLIEYWKDLFKTSPASKANTFESKLDMVKHEKAELKRQRNYLAEMQELYEQLYGKEEIKKLNAKEKRNTAFNNEFMVKRGSLSEVA
jgi:hypothetical protein